MINAINNLKEKLYILVAYMLPNDLAYWAAIRVMANATYVYSTKTPDQINIFEIMEAWDNKAKVLDLEIIGN